MASSPYDPYIPSSGQPSPYVSNSGQPSPYVPNSGQPSPGSPGQDNKQEKIKTAIDGALDTMRENITSVSERGARLDTLQDQTNNLADSAQQFRRGANQVRKKMWWKDMKMRIWLGVGIVVLLAIIIIPAVVTTTGK